MATYTPNPLGVNGDVAHDAVDSGNPVKVGAQARATEQTAVATADRVQLVADLVGKLITLPYANPENMLSGTASATGTSDTQIIASQGGSLRIYVTSIFIANSSASNTTVAIKDGSTELIRLPAPARSGAIVNLPVPLRLTAATALKFASTLGVTTMFVSAVGYSGV